MKALWRRNKIGNTDTERSGTGRQLDVRHRARLTLDVHQVRLRGRPPTIGDVGDDLDELGARDACRNTTVADQQAAQVHLPIAATGSGMTLPVLGPSPGSLVTTCLFQFPRLIGACTICIQSIHCAH